MSLLLREKCQETLDSFGLSHLHVKINKELKILAITTECGKPFIDIYGIEFSRVTPGEKEVNYASLLFDNFMGTHKEEISNFITKENEVKKFKSKLESNRKFKGLCTFTQGYGDELQIMCMYKDKFLSIKINKKGVSSITPFTTTTLENLTAYTMDKLKLKIAKEFLAKSIELNKLQNALDNLKSELNSCDI